MSNPGAGRLYPKTCGGLREVIMKLEEVARGYTRIAERYDQLLQFWFGKVLRIEKYRKEAVEWLALEEGDTVLDIGCGTGANFPFLVEKVGRRGRIIGLDYTEAMLRQAEKKIAERGWENITLIQGDAVWVNELVSTQVDAVLSTYCFSILYDLQKAFLNTLAVMKPGGRIVILDAKKVRPDSGLLRILYPLYSAMLRYYGIVSKEDLEEEKAVEKLELWERITKEHLVNLRYKEFLWGMFFLFRGDLKPGG